jgi:hypothetical protein
MIITAMKCTTDLSDAGHVEVINDSAYKQGLLKLSDNRSVEF